MPPPGQNWRWEDYDTGESGVMPWTQERDPTDYEIDSYRARERDRIENGGLKGWARSWIPDQVEDWWTERNKPHSTFVGDQIKEGYKASGGRPISIPSPLGAGFSIPIPQGMGEFAGSMIDDQTSDVNLALNAATLGGYAGLSSAGSGAKAALTGLGRWGARGQMAASGIGLGAGSVNMADAISKGDDATWGDYGNAALQLGLGAFGMWGGKGDLDAMSPKPVVKPPLNPRRLLGAGEPAIPPPPGHRFEAGPSGIGDLSDPNYVPGSAGAHPPVTPDAGPAGGISIAGLGDVAPLDLPLNVAPEAPTRLQTFEHDPTVWPQLKPPVDPRSPTNFAPFEQDPNIWQQMRQGPGGEPVDLAAHRLQDPVVPDTSLDGPGTSRPASDFWRTVVAEGAPEPTPRAVSARGVVEPPNIPDVAPPIDPTVAGVEDISNPNSPSRLAARAAERAEAAPFAHNLEDWKAEQREMGFDDDSIDAAVKESTELGVDPTKSDDLYDLENYLGAADDPDWIPEQETLGHWSKPELMAWSRENYGPGAGPGPVGSHPADVAGVEASAAADAQRAQLQAEIQAKIAAGTAQTAPTPAPVAPAPDALARVATVADQAPTPKPLVRPAVPKPPTPDRVLRIGRGTHDSVRAIFPDKLHVDLFSALGRLKRQMRGEKGVIPPNYEELAKKMGVTEKEARRISSEYRLKVLEMTKAAPEYAPEGTDVIDLEMPHWGGAKPDMVSAADVAPAPAPANVAPEAVGRMERIEAAKAQIAKQEAAMAQVTDPEIIAQRVAERNARVQANEAAAKLNATLEARGASPTPAAVPAPAGKLPKSKNARVRLIVEKLNTLSPGDVQALSNDPARLLSTAKAAGVKTETLKSTIQEWFKKAGGSETGGLKVGPSDARIKQMDEFKSKTQAWFKKMGGSEKGQAALPTKAQLIKGWETSFDAANSVRMTSMLSGLAFPKSLAGNLGAHLAAALEGRTLRPLKVLANIKAIRRDIKSGWQAGANPALTQGFNKANLPGRAMGAFDFAGIESLKRAGLSEKAAKELMLTGANQISSWAPLETRLGKLLVPFRTTPFNQLAQGITRWKKHPEVYAAAAALGAISGANVKDKEAISVMSAFAGPYAIPFLVGAWVGSGNMEMLNQISPMPEWGITKTIANPFTAFTESPGRRWFRPGVGFGEAAAKEKKRENLEKRRAKRRASRED